jgi:peptidoglycan/LPS O-acetylase OafA/YrhL
MSLSRASQFRGQVQERSPAGQHVPALDGVRGTAILLVLLFHFPAPVAWLRPFTSAGWCGVDLFFVLSGYLITGILYASAPKPHYFRNFYIRRCLRIFPLYYAFMILVLLVLPRFVNPYFLGLETLNGRIAPFLLYYSNYATVLVDWAPVSIGAFWSLAVEEHFYLFWPMFIKVTPRNRLLVWCTVIASLALLSRLAITGLHLTWLATYYLTTSRVDSLVVGAMTAILVRQHPEWPKRWLKPIGISALVVLCVIAVWRRGLIFNDWPMRTFGFSLLALLSASVVWVAGTGHGRLSRVFSNPVLVTLGKYSYCLYIVHMIVLTVFERWLGPRLFPALGWRANSPLPLFAAALAASFAIAWLSWRFYESPFLSLKSRLTHVRRAGTGRESISRNPREATDSPVPVPAHPAAGDRGPAAGAVVPASARASDLAAARDSQRDTPTARARA